MNNERDFLNYKTLIWILSTVVVEVEYVKFVEDRVKIQFILIANKYYWYISLLCTFNAVIGFDWTWIWKDL